MVRRLVHLEGPCHIVKGVVESSCEIVISRDHESTVADSEASPSGERDISSSPPFVFDPEEIREFWKPVSASCPGSQTYGIASGDREPLRFFSCNGAGFLMYTSVMEDFGVKPPLTLFEIAVLNQYDPCPTQLIGQLWHFARATGVLVIFKGIESKLRGWQESFVPIVPLSGTHPFWLDKQGWVSMFIFPTIFLYVVYDVYLFHSTYWVSEIMEARIGGTQWVTSSYASNDEDILVFPLPRLCLSLEDGPEPPLSDLPSFGEFLDSKLLPLGDGEKRKKKSGEDIDRGNSPDGGGSVAFGAVFLEPSSYFHRAPQSSCSSNSFASMRHLLIQLLMRLRGSRMSLTSYRVIMAVVPSTPKELATRHPEEKKLWEADMGKLKRLKSDQRQEILELKHKVQIFRDVCFIPLNNALYLNEYAFYNAIHRL
ncbi:uncharacterized protein G2W53_000997 [Senna tora]|uniref:Uncharacterized protein n=1 Tax=Senna tora TaxID=362788 RepID=A0A834XFD1_9FABA|nr:uncharacterized protein G2W53_000997 [Senna tora]